MASLQDQLLKAGLVDKQKAKQAQTEKRRKAKQKKKKGSVVVSEVQQQVQQSKQDQLSKDQSLNQEQQAILTQKADKAKIKQMLEQHSIKDYRGELDYNFTYEGKVKRLAIDLKTQKSLARGILAICVREDKFYLIVDKVALKLAEVDPAVLVQHNTDVEVSEMDEDDPYAGYEIPDDLMW